MNLFGFAAMGGLVSFTSTALGSLLYSKTFSKSQLSRFRLSVDFSLGVMLAAVGFSLVGPTALESVGDRRQFFLVMGAFATGAIAIAALAKWVDRLSDLELGKRNQALLAAVLLLHNFPEGMASGAGAAGLKFSASLPLLSAIALQNIPEGVLMVLSLQSLGFSKRTALLGGILSGGVEFVGALMAGGALQWTHQSLPFLLSMAGGAMLYSVLIELAHTLRSGKSIRVSDLTAGFLTVPLLNLLIGQIV